MNYSDTVTLTDLNSNISALHTKVDKLETKLLRDEAIIHAHPVMFVILLIGFFITMDFWAIAAQTTIHHFYPRGHLEWWETIIAAILSLVLLLWVGDRSGVRIRMLGET